MSAAKPNYETVVVVGLGMVGIAFSEKLLDLDNARRYRVVTFGEETHPEWYQQQDPDRFSFHVGETVVAINVEGRTVSTDAGRTVPYDHCVIATGSEATLPSYADLSIPGVFGYRNISDINKLLTYADKEELKDCSVPSCPSLLPSSVELIFYSQALVIGGGLLGLEAAKAIHDLSAVKDVTIVHRQAYPLSRQLDAQGGEIVLRRIKAMGVTFLGSTSIQRFLVDHEGRLSGAELVDGSTVGCKIVVVAIGITPRDDVARQAGLACAPRGGIVVDDSLQTSAKDIYAIGECASWKNNTYGLIAPGIEMADILAFNFTQARTELGDFRPRTMNNPDLSTKLKLMGVDVASFGDYFAEIRHAQHKVAKQGALQATNDLRKTHNASSPKKRLGAVVSAAAAEGPVEALTYIFSADGTYLLGGMMVGDTSDYVKLVALVKKKKALDVQPSQFILGSRSDKADAGDDLDDDAQICSCHNVSKGRIVQCIKDGTQNLADVKRKTKAGAGCGGCVPLLTNIVKNELKKAGVAVNNHICSHFAMSRADLFNVIKIKKLKTMPAIMEAVGRSSHAIGFLANIQRNGTFSVVPRVPAGEITPDKLIVLGQVAQKYGLYTKITGGQRVDLFGAQKADLPSIWKELVDAGFESGHAYGKALRTVKSCVGTSWCRYGIGDSVGLAVQLEQRYKGIRSPHKFKGGVSGCVRECAEAQGKDFGLIATDKGWNSATPRHATLLAADVPPSKVIQILDRFVMYYISTADKLMRTARWLEQMDGGIDKLRRVILDDELGICADLERDMEIFVNNYYDEWKAVVNDQDRQRQFRQFVNTVGVQMTEVIVERGQPRPADWDKDATSLILKKTDIAATRDHWTWRKVANVDDFAPAEGATTCAAVSSAAIRYGDSQIAIFHVPGQGYFATQQMCPHRRAFVLDHGIVSDDPQSGSVYVSCPMHKRNFDLTSGKCLNDESYGIISFEVKVDGDDILLLLPETRDLDAVIGTSRWMVRQASAHAADSMKSTVEIVGPPEVASSEAKPCSGGSCSSPQLDW
ncbi:hypothetical protein BN946_scf184803.g22 [Trametes cinnabarina]|uniref:Rieske domain-containing protein n=1 Tax=Pycnoporus cinnabarinus TaxID=5643 RepID=A0A060SC41_PYCCI|nr:hypothetical protein BN946_scf184803.g22 [Trametes cinnabarina]